MPYPICTVCGKEGPWCVCKKERKQLEAELLAALRENARLRKART